MFFYDGHISGLTARKKPIPAAELACPTCGLEDEYIGEAMGAVAARDLLWKWWYHGGKPYSWNQCMSFLRRIYASPKEAKMIK